MSRDLIDTNPVRGIKPLRDPGKHFRRALELKECRSLLAASPAYRRRVWTAYLCTGMRKMELVSRCWQHVDLDEGLIFLEAEITKTRVARHCIVGPRLAATIMEETSRGAGAPVWPNTKGGPYASNLIRDLRVDCKHAGVDCRGVDIHALRVSFSVLLGFVVEAPDAVRKVLLGHGSVRSGIVSDTKYMKPRMRDARLVDAARRLEDVLLG